MYDWRNDPLPTDNRWNTPAGRFVKFLVLLDRPTAQGSFGGVFIALPIGLLARHITGKTWVGIVAALAVMAIIDYGLYRLARYYGFIANYSPKPRLISILVLVVFAILVITLL